MDRWGVVVAASATKSPLQLAVLSAVNRYGNASFCPLVNVASPAFSLPSSALFTFNCSLGDYLGEGLVVCYMPKPGKLSTFTVIKVVVGGLRMQLPCLAITTCQ
ncbi:hypothetical protein BsWGS_20749 [Bradybaena similaris]